MSSTSGPAGATPPEVPLRSDGSAARLLVVDDEESLADLLVEALSFQGYDVASAPSGAEALAAVDTSRPDLIILDVNMPGLDGFAVADRLRSTGDKTPIIFLTARTAPDDLREGFGSGGDDYLMKPFRLEELSLRVSAVLRRTLGTDAGNPRTDDTVTVADLSLDLAAHQVTRGGKTVDLSPTEFRLLRYLAANAGRVVSKQELLKQVWGYDFDTESSLAETYVFYLRRKIDKLGPRLIHTVRGVGYMLRPPQE
ncbi:response regulator transcription factor [Glycomyces sp. L485]|uniref:response regulator transcription factor n=1 Tax=Glycomyces sp. L485 TaxID=2909235 RepID=UPI001F4A1873|nr:response regulator transcription factor [Glycomyces sp. L485]MCH7229883.1 response regulator transcription factor [Glycomyces sp. L485]